VINVHATRRRVRTESSEQAECVEDALVTGAISVNALELDAEIPEGASARLSVKHAAIPVPRAEEQLNRSGFAPRQSKRDTGDHCSGSSFDGLSARFFCVCVRVAVWRCQRSFLLRLTPYSDVGSRFHAVSRRTRIPASVARLFPPFESFDDGVDDDIAVP
jgi:hypothetical protein